MSDLKHLPKGSQLPENRITKDQWKYYFECRENIQTYKDLIVNKPILFDDLGSYKISLSELYDINLDLLYKTKDEYIKQQYKVREDSLLHHPDSAENQLYKTIKNKNLQQVFEVLFQKQLLFFFRRTRSSFNYY